MGQRTLADRMTVLDPPAFWPTLRASLSLFRHARPGLRDPDALPVIERAARDVTLDAAWLARYGASTCDARGEKRGMSFCIRTEASSDGEVVWQGSTRALASDPALAAKSRKRSVAEPHIADAAPPSPISETLLQVPEDMGATPPSRAT